MISSARLKYLRSSPQKTRLVVDQIRGLDVNDALATLDGSPKAVAVDVAKLLRSAVANAQKGDQRVDADTLYVSMARVDDGPRMKRIRPATFGRAFRILHRLCHVSIELETREGAAPRLSRAKRRAQEHREARKRASRGAPAEAAAPEAPEPRPARAAAPKKTAKKKPAPKKRAAKSGAGGKGAGRKRAKKG